MNEYEGIARLDGAARLDVYIASLGLFTRSQLKTRNLRACVNQKPAKLSRLVKSGDTISLSWDERPPLLLMPENIPLDIIYEDDSCVVINKAQGLVVHPGAGNHNGTLVNALLFRRGGKLPDTAENERPFIVHRLDKETSGIIIAAYTEYALRFLSAQFKDRTVRKIYAAVTQGCPCNERGEFAESGVFDNFLCRDTSDRQRRMVSDTRAANRAGKRAITRYKVARRWVRGGREYCLVILAPKTGRTHQLRVQLRHARAPILGDALYGKKDAVYPNASLMLHALYLEITLPSGTRRVFKAPLPERMKVWK